MSFGQVLEEFWKILKWSRNGFGISLEGVLVKLDEVWVQVWVGFRMNFGQVLEEVWKTLRWSGIGLEYVLEEF